jgi:hypothetical protein
MVGEIYYKGRMVGRIDVLNKTFFTTRNPNHYFIKYNGFGISSNILEKLKRNEIENIVIDYYGKKNYRLVTRTDVFLNKGIKYDNYGDEQYILNEKEFDLID